MTNGEPQIRDEAATGYQREAGTYARARPSYHPGLITEFVSRYGGGDVVEIGAGTGIFTTQLVDVGCIPTAIEPVDAMRERLSAALPAVDARPGTASASSLETSSADTVVAAQAFHWFDHRSALDEIVRLLRPSGCLVTVWNVRDESVPWVAAYTEVMDRHAGDTPRYRTMEWRDAIDSDDRFEFVEELTVANPSPTTPEGVAERGLSTSFIASLDPEQQAAVRSDLLDIVSGLGSSFAYPYVSEMQAWRLT